MRTGIIVDVSATEPALDAIVAGRNSAPKQVWRAPIVLLSAEGPRSNEIMRRTRKSKDRQPRPARVKTS